MPLPQLVKNGEIDISILRKEYLKAVEDSKGIDFLLHTLKKVNSQNGLVVAYQACLETLKAKSLWNPLEKLALAKQSQDTFARAVALNPLHLEIRFLRYSIQLSLPSYLYLSNHLEEDKQVILSLLQKKDFQDIDKESLQIITDFLLRQGQLQASEKEIVQKLSL
ncbi:MAG: hypothetical protein OHK0057_03680 [Thermoflexibacter sp.]